MYPNLIKSKYPVLQGRDWIRKISAEDRKVLIWLGMKAWDFGRLGGLARAKTALRDNRGRFVKTPAYEMDYGDMVA